MSKGPALNTRVWRLFEAAGFKTMPHSGAPATECVVKQGNKDRPIDLLAWDDTLKIRIIGSNKTAKKVKPFSGHVVDYDNLRSIEKAQKTLFVITDRVVDEEDRKFIAAHSGILWTRRELEYYDLLVSTIGEYAKYEIINSFGLTTHEEQDIHRLVAFRIHQPNDKAPFEVFLFFTVPARLLKTSVVLRRANNQAEAYQRMLQANRLKKLHDFLVLPDALLPTSIIVALSDEVEVHEIEQPKPLVDKGGKSVAISAPWQVVVLGIPMKYASLELIDGQHRLFGFQKTDPATKNSFQLAVVGIKGLSTEKRRDTFLAINENARRVNPNLVSYLKYTAVDSECQASSELMAIRVVVDLNEVSPFRGLIRLVDIDKGKITLKGFSGYDLKGLLGKSGWLRKAYPNNVPSEYVTALAMYFSALKSIFPTEWSDHEKYILATNRGISAFLKLLKSILRDHKQSPPTYDEYKQYLLPLKSKMNWETATLENNYVGSQGWKQFQRDMVKIIKKTFPSIKP